MATTTTTKITKSLLTNPVVALFEKEDAEKRFNGYVLGRDCFDGPLECFQIQADPQILTVRAVDAENEDLVGITWIVSASNKVERWQRQVRFRELYKAIEAGDWEVFWKRLKEAGVSDNARPQFDAYVKIAQPILTTAFEEAAKL